MKRPTAPKWLVADDPHPAYSSWDNRDGLTPKVMTRMDERPRIKTEPIHPPTPAEPVMEETEDTEGRGAFIAATVVLIGVVIWLAIEVTHAFQTGALL